MTDVGQEPLDERRVSALVHAIGQVEHAWREARAKDALFFRREPHLEAAARDEMQNATRVYVHHPSHGSPRKDGNTLRFEVATEQLTDPLEESLLFGRAPTEPALVAQLVDEIPELALGCTHEHFPVDVM